MPPSAIRRPITVTVWLIASVACLVLSAAATGDCRHRRRNDRRRQLPIVARLIVAYFFHELVTLRHADSYAW